MKRVRFTLALVLVLISAQLAFAPLAGAVRPGHDRPSDKPRLERDAKKDAGARSPRATAAKVR